MSGRGRTWKLGDAARRVEYPSQVGTIVAWDTVDGRPVGVHLELQPGLVIRCGFRDVEPPKGHEGILARAETAQHARARRAAARAAGGAAL